MNLREYLTENNIKVGDFAKRIGVDRVSVSRYLAGSRPTPAVIEKIDAETGGAVPPSEWFARSERAA